MTSNISTALATQLANLQTKKGSLTVEDMSGILENLAGSFAPGNASAEAFLRNEILRINNHIQATKKEIIALQPGGQSQQDISTAAIQLDAVLQATEKAAHTIMDAADAIQNEVAASGNPALQDKITELTATIYEACNFQDLTGQRIKKVMGALDFTEARIKRLISLFSSDGSIDTAELEKAAAETKVEDELLNGPQLPGSAPSQGDIDALFDKLK